MRTTNQIRLSAADALIVAASKRSWTLYRYLNCVVGAHVAGQRIAIPLYHRIGLYNLMLDDRDLRFVALLRRILKERPGTIIDVGVNIGQFLISVLLADRTRAWLGFEPAIACCNYVAHLIRANQLTNHRVLSVGLSNRPDVVTFFHANDTDVSASAIDGFYADQGARLRTPIVVDRGDAMLERVGDVDAIALLKIDTEGGELEVLEGFEKTIRKFRPLLIMEVAPYAHEVDKSVKALRLRRIQLLDAALNGYRYKLHRIRDGNVLEPVNDGLDPKQSTDLRNMDYLCVPEEFSETFSRSFDRSAQ